MKVQHAVGNAAAIAALPVTPGKIYFSKDTKKIFFDTADGRIEINSDVVAQVANLLAAVNVLNGDANVAGSVANVANAAAARKVAEIVGDADENLDTLEEIATWISSDEGGKAAAALASRVETVENTLQGMSDHGSRISGLESSMQLVVTNSQLANYALKTDLNDLVTNTALTTALADYVQNAALATYATKAALDALDTRVTALETANDEGAGA